MLVVMEQNASPDDIDRVIGAIQDLGFTARAIPGEQLTAIGVVGNDKRVDSSRIEGLPGVREVIHVSAPFKLVSREWKKEPTVIRLENGTEIGGNAIVVMGGPCAVENEDQIMRAAEIVRDAGATVLRGGAFKPRTSPYSFQGLAKAGLELLARARSRFKLAVVTEAIDAESADLIAEYADIVQIGARNMQNFALLKHVGRLKKPILLKRGLSATIKELLLAAEYIVSEGNEQVILCERGIRSFDDSTRNVLDIAAVPVVKSMSHLPTIADPSHGTGRRDKVTVMARAAIAAGADGLIVEMHPEPERALSDGMQSLYPDQFTELMREVERVALAIDRSIQRVRGAEKPHPQ
jgi:3-deoxy-7-phosphoheptulonate synthase